MNIFGPINRLADVVTYQWLNIQPHSYWGGAVHFFVYDLVKIGVLMVVINYVVTISGYYFPMEKVRDILTRKRWYGMDYLLAALLGVVTPFCSCSSIPLFMGFISARIPLGVTFAFLISSPLVNESSLYLFPSIFGLKVTLLYNLVGVLVAMLGGMIIEKLGMEKYIREEFLRFKSKRQVEAEYEGEKVPVGKLAKMWSQQAWRVTKEVFPYVMVGVAIGAFIHGFVPEALVSKYLAKKSWWVIPLAVVMGAPLYANSVGVVPIIEALVGKGIPMGTALAFMTATVTISIPEGLMLAKIMKRQLLATFLGVVIMGMVVMGYLFNVIL